MSTRVPDPRHALGHAGEAAAAGCLERHGFTILARRWRVGRHEVDLVARREAMVVFAEVKTRLGGSMGAPECGLRTRQRRVIERLALIWLARYGGPRDCCRFDLLAVRPVPDGWAVRWIPDAWRPDTL